MTVYADILFLINFIFDAEILVLLCKIYSKKVPVLRVLLSATVGGLFGVFAFVPYFGILAGPPARVVMPFIMTALVFLPCKKEVLASVAAIFMGMSFIVSGAVSFFGLKGFLGIFVPVPVYGIVLLIKKNSLKRRSTTILCYKDFISSEDGFFDSGNMLTYKNAPVILGNQAVFERLFGKGFSIFALSEWVDSKDVRMVPYASLGKSGAVMGIQLDYAQIGGKKYPKAVLAYSADKFSEELILNSVMT